MKNDFPFNLVAEVQRLNGIVTRYHELYAAEMGCPSIPLFKIGQKVRVKSEADDLPGDCWDEDNKGNVTHRYHTNMYFTFEEVRCSRRGWIGRIHNIEYLTLKSKPAYSNIIYTVLFKYAKKSKYVTFAQEHLFEVL